MGRLRLVLALALAGVVITPHVFLYNRKLVAVTLMRPCKYDGLFIAHAPENSYAWFSSNDQAMASLSEA